MVVVVLAALGGRADAATADPDGDPGTVVSTIDDPRIVEASGLAISRAQDDLAYVVNDSGQAQEVYAVRVSTGAVVGTTSVTGGTWRDTEALSIDDDGTLWVADTGDNFVNREDAALYSFAEPGPGDHTAAARRYPVSYANGPEDVEALLVQPGTGAKFLVSKGFVAGTVYELPDSLSTTTTNVAEPVGERAPALVTDGAFTPDGERALLRTYGDVREVEPGTWAEERQIATPAMEQSESLGVERGGSTFLIGSEGESSPLIRMTVPTGDPVPTATPTPTATPVPVDDAGQPRASQGFAGRSWFGVAGAMIVLVGISAWIAKGR